MSGITRIDRNNSSINTELELLPPLVFNISILGDNTAFIESSAHSNELRKIFNEIIDFSEECDKKHLGFLENSTIFQVLIPPETNYPVLQKIIPEQFQPYYISPSANATLKTNNDSYIPLVQFDFIESKFSICGEEYYDWIMEQSDLLFVVWDGSKTHQDGVTWHLLLKAEKLSLPVIWFNPEIPEKIFWRENNQNDPFEDERLKLYIRNLLGLGIVDKKSHKIKDLNVLINPDLHQKPFWSNQYRRFINRFRIPSAEPGVDLLVENDTSAPLFMRNFESKLNLLRKYFHHADHNAIVFNDYYRSTLLLRAVLPFIASIGLVFGFYSKSVGGYLFNGLRLNWEILATIGFFSQALCNLFIHWLSDHNNNRGWHKHFVNQRYIAEVLRMAIHFHPLNLPLGYESESESTRKISTDSPISHRLRSILRSTGINTIDYKKPEIKDFFFSQSLALLNDQINYHRHTAKKFKTIFFKLNRTATILFWVGFIIVEARAIFQGIERYLNLNQWIQPHTLLLNSIETAISGQTFITSFANLLALLMPAVAVMIFAVLNLCGFKDLYLRSEQMEKNLITLRNQIENERDRNDLNYDDYCRYSRKIITLLLRETTDWYTLVTSKKITRN